MKIKNVASVKKFCRPELFMAVVLLFFDPANAKLDRNDEFFITTNF